MSDTSEATMGRVTWVTGWVPRDPLRWSRLRWLSLAWIWALGAVLFGGLLLFGGSNVILAKGAWAVYANIAGANGVRIGGAAVMLCGLVLVSALGLPLGGFPEPTLVLQRGLKSLSAFYGWCAVEFCLAPLVPGGSFSWLGVIIFPMLASLPLILSLKGPPTLVPRWETELIEASIQLGASREFAKALAERLYGGSDEVH